MAPSDSIAVIRAANQKVISELSECPPGYLPHAAAWCQFVDGYKGKYDYQVNGIIDRVIRKPRRVQKAWSSDLSQFIVVWTTHCLTSGHTVLKSLRTLSDTGDNYYHYIPCACCGTWIMKGDAYAGALCPSCTSKHLKFCSICNSSVTFDDFVYDLTGVRRGKYRRRHDRETIVCEVCAGDAARFRPCAKCGTPVYRSEVAHGREGRWYCQNCATTNDVIACRTCNYWFDKSMIVPNTRGQCMQCYIREKSVKARAEVHTYSYKVPTVFVSTAPEIRRTYGLEIEVDEGNGSPSVMEYLKEQEHLLRLKEDGSLDSSESFEVVTLPMTLDAHRQVMPYANMFSVLKNDGYTSQDNDTCGIHIHAGRLGFGKTVQTQKAAIARMVWIVEAFSDQFKKFSRRYDFGYCHFYCLSSRYTPMEMYREVENVCLRCGDRHTVINIQNDHTVEFRLFKGSLRRSTVVAAIELYDYLIRYVTRNKDDTKYRPGVLTWEKFISGVKTDEYPDLYEYLISKGLKKKPAARSPVQRLMTSDEFLAARTVRR